MGRFLWGTYNSSEGIPKASFLGFRLTEVPISIFLRGLPESYFEEYGREAKKRGFHITAQGPALEIGTEGSLVEQLRTIAKVKLAGADVYFFFPKIPEERAVEDLKAHLMSVSELHPDLIISVGTTFSGLATFENVLELVTSVNRKNLVVGLQLENIWLESFLSGKEVGEDPPVKFWIEIFDRLLEAKMPAFVLRFSQIKIEEHGGRTYKVRTPLGEGLPGYHGLAEAISLLLLYLHEKRSPLPVFLTYSGPSETRFYDTVVLYSEIVKSLSRKVDRCRRL